MISSMTKNGNIFFVEFFKSWLPQEKKSFKKTRYLSKLRRDFCNQDHSRHTSVWRLQPAYFPLIGSEDPKGRGKVWARHRKRDQEVAAGEAPRGFYVCCLFLYILLCEKKELFIQHDASGDEGENKEQRPSDLQELLAVVWPLFTVCRKLAIQTPNFQP